MRNEEREKRKHVVLSIDTTASPRSPHGTKTAKGIVRLKKLDTAPRRERKKDKSDKMIKRFWLFIQNLAS
jgi:hypothetical protein